MVCVPQADFTKALILNSCGVDSSVINTEANMPEGVRRQTVR